MADKKLSFEDAMKRIEEIVNLLENGKSTLDESLKLFEEATSLCVYCNNRLDEAKKKVAAISIVSDKKEEE